MTHVRTILKSDVTPSFSCQMIQRQEFVLDDPMAGRAFVQEFGYPCVSGYCFWLQGVYAPAGQKCILPRSKKNGKKQICSLSHPNVNCKFPWESLSMLTCAKKNKSNDKQYLQMLHLILFFSLTKHCYPVSHENWQAHEKSTKKKSDFLKFIYYLFLLYCSPGSIAKTPRPCVSFDAEVRGVLFSKNKYVRQSEAPAFVPDLVANDSTVLIG